MKLRQLRYIHEVAKRGLNITAAAEALFTSQPGISKQIRMLEEELGVEVFLRNGKHLTEVTPAGQRILEYTERMLRDVDSIQNIAKEFRQQDAGDLAIATTHTRPATRCRRSSASSAIASPRSICTCTRARRRRSPNWRPPARPTSRSPPRPWSTSMNW